jgi:hypothetical protein
MALASGSRPRIRYEPDAFALVVGRPPDEVSVRHDGSSGFVGRIEDVGAVGASELQRVLRRVGTNSEDQLIVVESEDFGFEPDEGYRLPEVSFRILDDRLVLKLYAEVNDWTDDEGEVFASFNRLLRPMLQRGRAQLVAVDLFGTTRSTSLWSLFIAPVPRGRDVVRERSANFDRRSDRDRTRRRPRSSAPTDPGARR